MGVERPNKIVYKDLSYQIMSVAYEVHIRFYLFYSFV